MLISFDKLMYFIPILENQFFYMAIPDWDIPLYKITKFSFLLHRSWLFHSVLLPIGLLSMSFGVIFAFLAADFCLERNIEVTLAIR
jgi:hypothetical protein